MINFNNCIAVTREVSLPIYNWVRTNKTLIRCALQAMRYSSRLKKTCQKPKPDLVELSFILTKIAAQIFKIASHSEQASAGLAIKQEKIEEGLQERRQKKISVQMISFVGSLLNLVSTQYFLKKVVGETLKKIALENRISTLYCLKIALYSYTVLNEFKKINNRLETQKNIKNLFSACVILNPFLLAVLEKTRSENAIK